MKTALAALICLLLSGVSFAGGMDPAKIPATGPLYQQNWTEWKALADHVEIRYTRGSVYLNGYTVTYELRALGTKKLSVKLHFDVDGTEPASTTVKLDPDSSVHPSSVLLAKEKFEIRVIELKETN